ncbi:MAG: hypothetical protein B7Z45_11005 [Azorhizobium sp. 12-66-6]|nr:MAG: hypothetical protein B7Z45_11005 [Azorhizobium sp. 12-66-6]
MPRRAIAHILPWANVGGTELATLRLAEAMRAGGRDTVIYVPDDAAEVADLVRDHGFALARYAHAVPRRANPLPYLVATARLALDFRHNRPLAAETRGALPVRLGRNHGRAGFRLAARLRAGAL